MDIETCVGNFSGSILEALAASTPKSCPYVDQIPQIPAGIQDEIRLKTLLRRRWQDTRDSDLKAKVNRLQRSMTRQLNEWMNDRWSTTLESMNPEDQSLWRVTKRVIRILTPSTPWTQGGRALSDSEKAETLADSLEAVSAGHRSIVPGRH